MEDAARDTESPDRADLGLNGSDRAFVLVGFPVGGAVVGAVLPWVWKLVDGVDWIPFQGPISALMSLDSGWQSVLRVAILAVAGLVFAGYVVANDTKVSIGPEDILVRRNGSTRRIRREQVAAAHYDGKHLVIETAEGRKLLEEPVENAKREAGAAFTRFGYPWENL